MSKYKLAVLLVVSSSYTLFNEITLGEKFVQNFISSKVGPVKNRNKEGWKRARRVPYGTMVKKKDKKTTLHLLNIYAAYVG